MPPLPSEAGRPDWLSHSVSLNRFLADMVALLGRPIFSGCGWLWCYISPMVVLGLLTSVFVYLVKGPLVYFAWDSSTVSVLSHILKLLPVPCELGDLATGSDHRKLTSFPSPFPTTPLLGTLLC